MKILAIDPGTTESAWMQLDSRGRPDRAVGWATHGKGPNEELIARLRDRRWEYGAIVIEKVESYGMAVGAEVFETVWWAGRFAEACHPVPVVMLPRRTVKLALCHDSRAKDANIRQALIDRFGGKDAAIGRKAEPGPLYGVAGDAWSALAIGVTYLELQR